MFIFWSFLIRHYPLTFPYNNPFETFGHSHYQLLQVDQVIICSTVYFLLYVSVTSITQSLVFFVNSTCLHVLLASKGACNSYFRICHNLCKPHALFLHDFVIQSEIEKEKNIFFVVMKMMSSKIRVYILLILLFFHICCVSGLTNGPDGK